MKSLLIIILSFSCLFSLGQTGSIKGNIVTDAKSLEKLKDDIVVSLAGKHTPEQNSWGTELDFSSVPVDTFSLHIYDFGCLDTTIRNIIVRANETTKLQITLLSTCQYDKNAKNKECPVCHKSDETIPIIYGLLVNTGKSKKHRKENFYPGGCEISCCDPNWYCRRDQIEF